MVEKCKITHDQSTTPPTQKSIARPQGFLIRYASNLPIVIIFLLVFLGFGLTTERFLSPINIFNVLRQSSPAVIVAVASTLVIVSSGIDLSIGSIASFAGVLTAVLLQLGISPLSALILILLMGILTGLVNGYIIAYQGVPSFIVTLATLSILLGLAQLFGQGFSIPIETDPWFIAIGQGYFAFIPIPVLIAGIVTIIVWLILSRTKYGLHIKGIGSNEEAVRRAGIPVKLIAASVYILNGFAAALAGIIIAARLQAGTATAGRGLELQIIAAVVLGGTSLFGGRGTILGTVLGVFTIAFITNGLVLNHVTPFWVTIIQGVILLLALWANTRIFSRWL